MITIKDLYNVLSAMVPLYVAMMLAYGSVKCWKIFTPVQCSGINRFVAVFAVPLLSFHFISSNNPYKMDGLFILADTMSKLAVLFVLACWTKFSKRGSLDWMITIFALATLPNTLVMGIPLLSAMYGQFYGGLMVQVVVLQCIIWYTLMLFLFEYRAARLLVMEQFPDTAASIIAFKVDSDIVSLDGREPMQTLADVGDDGKIKVTIRKSISSMPSSKAITPRPSNLTGADVYSVYSSRNNTPGHHGLNNQVDHDLRSMMMMMNSRSPRQSNFTASDVYSVQSSRGPTPRASNVNTEDSNKEAHAIGGRGIHSPRSLPPVSYGPTHGLFRNQLPGYTPPPPPPPAPGVGGGAAPLHFPKKAIDPRASPKVEDDGKELHMFIWSSTASPMSEGGLHPFDAGANENAKASNGLKEARLPVRPSSEQRNGDMREPLNPQHLPSVPYIGEDFSFGSKAAFPGDTTDKQRQSASRSSIGAHSPNVRGKPRGMPPATVMVKLILQMVGRKLLRNPNTYSSLIGLVWSLISFRWNVGMPKIMFHSISILSDAGLGMAMFSLGLFMALQPRLIACGMSLAVFAMAVKFLTGPAVMAAASIAVGLRGVDLHAAIVQAALPQGIVPFVFAREYDLHPDILSTAVIFGMLVALPTTLLYYVLLGI